MAEYRIGLIGCGGRQHAHVPAFRALGNCTIVAAVDRVATLREEFCAKHQIPAAYETVTEMIEAERPDIVTVVTRAVWMKEPVLEAIAAGVRGILLEKPFGVDLEDSRAMLAAAEERGTALCVNHQYRFFDHADRMRELLAGGDLGEVEYYRSISAIKLHGQGTHMIDFVRYLHGDRPFAWALGTFCGDSSFDAKQPGPDFDVGVLQFDDGVPLYVEAGPGSSRTPYPDEQLNLYADAVCTRGRVWFGLSKGLRIWYPDGRYEEDTASWPAISEPAQVRLVESLLHTIEIGEIGRCDARYALATQEALCALLASGLEHRRVTFPPEIAPRLMERVRAALSGG